MRRSQTALAMALAGAASTGGAATASADALPGTCSSGHQIGATSSITFGGQTAASVKQYAGICDGHPRNWAYVWVWDSFRAGHRVRTESGIFDYRTNTFRGLTGFRAGQETHSRPVGTIHDCTSAVAVIKVVRPGPDATAGGYTPERC